MSCALRRGGLTVLALASLVTPALGQHYVVYPGVPITLTDGMYDEVNESKEPWSGAVIWSADVVQRKIKAYVLIYAGAGNDVGSVDGYLYNRFCVVGPTDSPSLLATISGSVDWKAFLQYLPGSAGYTQARVEIWAELWEINVESGETMVANSLVTRELLKGPLLPDLDGASSPVIGDAPYAFTVQLRRGGEADCISLGGRTYYQVRVRVKLVANSGATGFMVGISAGDAPFFDGYVHAGDIQVAVEADLAGEIAMLRTQFESTRAELNGLRTQFETQRTELESTQAELNGLRTQFETHMAGFGKFLAEYNGLVTAFQTHTLEHTEFLARYSELVAAFQTHSHAYKTGEGAGHNNVSANTSTPVGQMPKD